MTGVSRHTVCWLIRHGQTAWNRERRYLSRTDVPLTTVGCRQAEAVAWRLRRQPVAVVVYSGLGRTEQTAIIIAAGRERSPKIEVDRGWREADHGRWEGLTYAELMARFPEEAQARFGDPWSVAAEGGESLAAVQRRVLDAWRALLQRHDGARIAIVTHATPIQLVLCDLLRIAPYHYWQLRIDPGSISWVDLYPSAAIIRAINEMPPLRPQVAP